MFTALLVALEDAATPADVVASKLQEAGPRLALLSKAFAGPDATARAGLAAAAAKTPTWLTVPASDQQAAAILLSQLLNLHEDAALDLLRAYVRIKDGAQILSAGRGSRSAGHAVAFPLGLDDLLQALELHYEERLAVLRILTIALRSSYAPDHAHHAACKAWVADLLQRQPQFAVAVAHAFADVANRPLPANMADREPLWSAWARQTLHELAGYLEVLFLLLYEAQPARASTLEAILTTLTATDFGMNARAATLPLDRRSRELLTSVQDRCTLVLLCALRLETFCDDDRGDVPGWHDVVTPPDVETLRRFGATLLKLTSRPSSAARAVLGPVHLAWGSILARLKAHAEDTRNDLMTIDTPLPSRVAELRGAGTRPVQLPATQAARQLLDSIADGTGSGVEEHIRRAFALKAFESLTAALLPDRMPLDDPSTVAYKSVGKGVLGIFLIAFSLADLSDPFTVYPLAQAIFAHEPALCRQFWEHDYASPDQRQLLTMAEEAYPRSLARMVPLLVALSGTAPFEAVAAKTADKAARTADVERTVGYVAQYFTQLPSFLQEVSLRAGAVGLDLREPDDGLASTDTSTADWLHDRGDGSTGSGQSRWAPTVWTLQPWALLGGLPEHMPTAALVLPPNTVGTLASASSDVIEVMRRIRSGSGDAAAPTTSGTQLDLDTTAVAIRWRYRVSGFTMLLVDLDRILRVPAERTSDADLDVAAASAGLLCALLRGSAAFPALQSAVLAEIARSAATTTAAAVPDNGGQRRVAELILATLASCIRWAVRGIEASGAVATSAAPGTPSSSASTPSSTSHDAARRRTLAAVVADGLLASCALVNTCAPLVVLEAATATGLLVPFQATGAASTDAPDDTFEPESYRSTGRRAKAASSDAGMLAVSTVLAALAAALGGRQTATLAFLQWSRALVARVCWPLEGVQAIVAASAGTGDLAEQRRLAEAVTTAVMAFASSEVLPNHGAWRYQSPGERYQVALAALTVVDDLLARVPVQWPLGAPGSSHALPVLVGLQHSVLDAFLNTQPLLLQALMAAVTVGPDALEALYRRERVGDARLAEAVVCQSLAIFIRLVNYQQRLSRQAERENRPYESMLVHTVFEPARTSGAAASDSVLVLASYVRYPYNYRVPQLALHALVRICSLADAGHAQKRTSSLLGYLGDRAAGFCELVVRLIDAPENPPLLRRTGLSFVAAAIEWQPGLAELLVHRPPLTSAKARSKKDAALPSAAAATVEPASALLVVLLRIVDAPEGSADAAIADATLRVLLRMWAQPATFASLITQCAAHPSLWSALVTRHIVPALADAEADAQQGRRVVARLGTAGVALQLLASHAATLTATPTGPFASALLTLFQARPSAAQAAGGGPAVLRWTQAVRARRLPTPTSVGALVRALAEALHAAGLAITVADAERNAAGLLQLLQPLAATDVAASDASARGPALSAALLSSWTGRTPTASDDSDHAPDDDDHDDDDERAMESGTEHDGPDATATERAARLLAAVNRQLQYDDACAAITVGVHTLVAALAALAPATDAAASSGTALVGPRIDLGGGSVTSNGGGAGPPVTVGLCRVGLKLLGAVLQHRREMWHETSAVAAAIGPSGTGLALANLIAWAVLCGITAKGAAQAAWTQRDRDGVLAQLADVVAAASASAAEVVALSTVTGRPTMDPVLDTLVRTLARLASTVRTLPSKAKAAAGSSSATATDDDDNNVAAVLDRLAPVVLALSAAALAVSPGGGSSSGDGTTPPAGASDHIGRVLLRLMQDLLRPSVRPALDRVLVPMRAANPYGMTALVWDPATVGWIDAALVQLRRAFATAGSNAHARANAIDVLDTLVALLSSDSAVALIDLVVERGGIDVLCSNAFLAMTRQPQVLRLLLLGTPGPETTAASTATAAGPAHDAAARRELVGLVSGTVRVLALLVAAPTAHRPAITAAVVVLLLQLDEPVASPTGSLLDVWLAQPVATLLPVPPPTAHVHTSKPGTASAPAATGAARERDDAGLAVDLLQLHELVLRQWLRDGGPAELMRSAGSTAGGPARTTTGQWIRRHLARVGHWLPALCILWQRAASARRPAGPAGGVAAASSAGNAATRAAAADRWLAALLCVARTAFLFTPQGALVAPTPRWDVPDRANQNDALPSLPAWLPTFALRPSNAAPQFADPMASFGAVTGAMTVLADYVTDVGVTGRADALALGAVAEAWEILAVLTAAHLLAVLREAAAQAQGTVGLRSQQASQAATETAQQTLSDLNDAAALVDRTLSATVRGWTGDASVAKARASNCMAMVSAMVSIVHTAVRRATGDVDGP